MKLEKSDQLQLWAEARDGRQDGARALTGRPA
jgi:hypothetical protein